MPYPLKETCLLVVDDDQFNVAACACCSFDLTSLNAALARLAEDDLAARVGCSVGSAEALAISLALTAAANTVYSYGSDIASEVDAADELSVAAAWYEHLARSGYGVLVR